MRIAYVAQHGSIHTRRWVSFFAARGHEVHVITCGNGDVVDTTPDGHVLPRNYQVHDLGAPWPGKLGYFRKVRRARRLLREIDPDVVHAHFATSFGMIAERSGVRPLVVTAHGDDVLISPHKPFLGRIVRRVLREASLITVPADHMRDAVVQLLGDRADDVPVAVFQYGVEVGRLEDVARRVAVGREAGGPLRIISTRALLDIYRIDLLLDALAVLRSGGAELRCDIVGDGPLRPTLEQQVDRLGLDAVVRFHGHVEPERLEELVAASDVYVSVSESDGVSLSLLEALALGPVPVLSDIPANRSWVHDGETGVLTALDAAAIAGAITRAAALDRDRVARDNRAIVAERADRDTNLAACELLIDDLVGVQWEPDPVRPGEHDAA